MKVPLAEGTEQALRRHAEAMGISPQDIIRFLVGQWLQGTAETPSGSLTVPIRVPPGAHPGPSESSLPSPHPEVSAAPLPAPLSTPPSYSSPSSIPPESPPIVLPLESVGEPASVEPERAATEAPRRKRREAAGPPEIPAEIDSPELRAALADFEAHRRHLRKPINGEGWKLLYRRLEVAGKGEAETAVRWAIAEGWQSWQMDWMKISWAEARRQLGMPASTSPAPAVRSHPTYTPKLSPKGYELPIVATPWGPDEIAEFDEKMEALDARGHDAKAIRPVTPDPAGAARRHPADAGPERAGIGSAARAREVERPPPAALDLFAREG